MIEPAKREESSKPAPLKPKGAAPPEKSNSNDKAAPPGFCFAAPLRTEASIFSIQAAGRKDLQIRPNLE
jgi:hypothetical protein